MSPPSLSYPRFRVSRHEPLAPQGQSVSSFLSEPSHRCTPVSMRYFGCDQQKRTQAYLDLPKWWLTINDQSSCWLHYPSAIPEEHQGRTGQQKPVIKTHQTLRFAHAFPGDNLNPTAYSLAGWPGLSLPPTIVPAVNYGQWVTTAER